MITSNGDNNMYLRKNSSRSANTGLLLLLLNYCSLMINDATRIIRIHHNVHSYSALICIYCTLCGYLQHLIANNYEHGGSYDVKSLLGCHSIPSRLACCYSWIIGICKMVVIRVLQCNILISSTMCHP